MKTDPTEQDVLIEAIYEQRLISIDSSAAQKACQNIHSTLTVEAHRLQKSLADVGMPATATLPKIGQQYHRFQLTLQTDSPDAAIDSLVGLGYWQPFDLSSLGWQKYKRMDNRLMLTHTGPTSTRVDIDWQPWSWQHSPFRYVHPVLIGAKVQQMLGRAPYALDTFGEFLATPEELIRPLLNFAELSPTDVLIDLGCGDGRILIEASRAIGCRAIGIEREASLCRLAQEKVSQAGLVDRIEIIESDDYREHLTTATVLFSFVPMSALATEFEQIKTCLPSTARIIAHEQVRLPTSLPEPSRSQPLLGEAAVTVAHCWAPNGG